MVYETELLISERTFTLDIDIRQISSDDDNFELNLRKKYDNDFTTIFISSNYLLDFVSQFKKINGFKSHLKKNISLKSYFDKKIQKARIETNLKQHGLNKFKFNKPLDGQTFMKDYTGFVKKLTDQKMRNRISNMLMAKLSY